MKIIATIVFLAGLVGCSSSSGTQVLTQPCSGSVQVYGYPKAGAAEQFYDAPAAVFSFPGVSWQQLYGTVTVAPTDMSTLPETPDGGPGAPGFDAAEGFGSPLTFRNSILFKDGEVDVLCAPGTSATVVVEGGAP